MAWMAKFMSTFQAIVLYVSIYIFEDMNRSKWQDFNSIIELSSHQGQNDNNILIISCDRYGRHDNIQIIRSYKVQDQID